MTIFILLNFLRHFTSSLPLCNKYFYKKVLWSHGIKSYQRNNIVIEVIIPNLGIRLKVSDVDAKSSFQKSHLLANLLLRLKVKTSGHAKGTHLIVYEKTIRHLEMIKPEKDSFLIKNLIKLKKSLSSAITKNDKSYCDILSKLPLIQGTRLTLDAYTFGTDHRPTCRPLTWLFLESDPQLVTHKYSNKEICVFIREVIWNAPKSMWKIYFSRDGICLFFWNAQNSKNFSFSLFFVRILITCSFFEMPDFHMFDYFEMPNFRIRMNRKSCISK